MVTEGKLRGKRVKQYEVDLGFNNFSLPQLSIFIAVSHGDERHDMKGSET